MSDLDNGRYRVKLQILACIAEADCFYEIERAADAMFHARLVYTRTKDSLALTMAANSSGTEATP